MVTQSLEDVEDGTLARSAYLDRPEAHGKDAPMWVGAAALRRKTPDLFTRSREQLHADTSYTRREGKEKGIKPSLGNAGPW
jgi:hypothetical protein